jgi:hypothetical protein
MGLQGWLYVWMGVSIFLALLLQLALWAFLRSRGVQVAAFWIGMPGHMDAKYKTWCRQNERNYYPMIFLRALLLFSIVMSLVAINFVSQTYSVH